MFKSLLVAVVLVVLSLVSVGAFATSGVHTLTGSIIFTKIPGNVNVMIQENVNSDFMSEAACLGAKSAKEHSTFSPLASVTAGAPSEGDIRKFVNLQCVPKF